MLINGDFRDSETSEWVDVTNPVSRLKSRAIPFSRVHTSGFRAEELNVMQATQEVVSRMPVITNGEFEEAVQAAKDAFPAWKRTPVPHRQRVMLKFQQLIRENMVRPAILVVMQATQHQQLNIWPQE